MRDAWSRGRPDRKHPISRDTGAEKDQSSMDWKGVQPNAYLLLRYARECTGQEDPRNHMENHDLRHEVACTHEF